jgi:predicted peptidase
MIRRYPAVWICLLLSAQAFSQDLSLFEKKTYTSPEGQVLPYRILYPEGFDKAKKYPLVLFLHGAGERGNDNEKQLTHGAKLFLSDQNRKQYPAIVIFPQCPAESFWSTVKIDNTKTPREFTFDYTRKPNVALVSAIEVVKQTIAAGSVDKKRAYIAGLSMGGMGTFEALYLYPKMFSAALPICGGGDATHYDKRIKKTSFWVFHGAVDAVVDVKYSRQMVERLKQLKADVRYSEYPDVNHNSWDNAFAEPDFMKWMFDHK